MIKSCSGSCTAVPGHVPEDSSTVGPWSAGAKGNGGTSGNAAADVHGVDGGNAPAADRLVEGGDERD